jgi:hypothetical protein
VNSNLQFLNLFSNEVGSSDAAAIAQALMRHSTLRLLDLRYNKIGDAGVAAIEESFERSCLRMDQNSHFPHVYFDGKTWKYEFLYALSEMGFRLFIMNDVSAALWPHALATVKKCPWLIFHLLIQISGSCNLVVKDPPGSDNKLN